MTTRPARILVVDDEPDLRTLYELTLLRAGYEVESAPDLTTARQHLVHQTFDAVITDMRLPDGQGLELVRELNTQSRPEKTLVITAYGSPENAVEALKAGAFDYLTKPVDLKHLRTAVAAALQRAEPSNTQPPVQAIAAQPAPTATAAQALARIVGHSATMVAVRQRVQRVAPTMAPVLVLGESGTGKELVARALHACSQRASGPFVAVNCGAIPENLMEAEFFGVRKGAYTGATQDREGYFQAAQGGTLFLDELGDLPLPMQAKLLRVIQERQVRPLGGTEEETLDVRIVSATHHNLQQAVAQCRFRQDLFYRLNVIELRIPPLRERPEDLHDLAHNLLHRLCREAGYSHVQLSEEALSWLEMQTLPGNVRELENILHRGLALCSTGTLELEDLTETSTHIAASPASTDTAKSAVTTGYPRVDSKKEANWLAEFDQVERNLLLQTLQSNDWDLDRTSQALDLTHRQIAFRLRRLHITPPKSMAT